MARVVTSKNIEGIADLVVVAPIREGFIDAYENITYETRLRIVAEALHNVRVSAREHERTTPFSDTTERILTLLDFRIGILDRNMFSLDDDQELVARRYLYLTATFDGALEPYMRLIWNPLGAFLDLLFCNCEGYVPACDNSFADYIAWVRSAQVDSAIFYSTTGLTVKDQIYLRNLERVQRQKPPATGDLEIARLTMPDPEVAATHDRGNSSGSPIEQLMALKADALALEALSVLYRLADYYPPDRVNPSRDPVKKRDVAADGVYRAEGRYLLRATQSLLKGWNPDAVIDPLKSRYAEQLRWFNTDRGKNPTKHLASRQAKPTDPRFDRKQVQAGIYSPFAPPGVRIERGALLLMTIKHAQKVGSEPGARAFLKMLLDTGQISFDGDAPDAQGFLRTISFTANGLLNIGMSKRAFDHFPKEFREGMEKRAGLIGDYRENHPRNWCLPERNWPRLPAGATNLRPPVEINEIDFIIQLRLVTDPTLDAEALDARLDAEIERLADDADKSGVVLAAFEPMLSTYAGDQIDPGLTREHFGFVDGLSQPVPTPNVTEDDAARTRDTVRLGEVVQGYRNDHGDFAGKRSSRLPDYRFNGSFHVVRKIEQFPEIFENFLKSESQRILAEDGVLITPRELAAKLMGREYDGQPLVPTSTADRNDFSYATDAYGDACPFASHVRRTNPREPFQTDAEPLHRPAPRLVRRGMSFGKRGDPNTKRGLIFMAYGASIAEQYEVIQRWINGGNSTNISAAQNDPILGVRPAQGEAVFRFIHKGQVIRVHLPGPFVPTPFNPNPAALTRLHWGAYLFAPSRAALTAFCTKFRGRVLDIEDPHENQGRNVLEKLKALADENPPVAKLEWKRILEDFDTKDPEERSLTPDIFSAIRWYKGGVYKIPATIAPPKSRRRGLSAESDRDRVLVASRQLMLEVLSRPDLFSVQEQGDRIAKTAGPIYVAMQPDDPNYVKEAPATNRIMYELSEQYGYESAYRLAKAQLQRLVAGYESLPQPIPLERKFKFELRRDFLTPTLAALCTEWFGLPDGDAMVAGGWSWDSTATRKARCPGDFLSPSRDAFYPEPTNNVTDYAKRHGALLSAAGKKFVGKLRQGKVTTGAVLSKRMASAIPEDGGAGDDILARNIIGMMIGALPPVDGNMRGVMLEWLSDRSLWRHQAALRRAAGDAPASYEFGSAVLRGPITRAICKRPAPDLLYRVAKGATVLKARRGRRRPTNVDDVEVKEGDLIIISQVSAAQWSMQNSRTPDGDASLVFGGYRYSANQRKGQPTHACPAQKLMMGTMMGIMAALLDAGRIQSLPSALIVQLSGWRPGYAVPPVALSAAIG